MNVTKVKPTEYYLALLGDGDERGLNFFYQRFYQLLYMRMLRAAKNDCCAAMSIVQEAFLRLWLCRAQVKTEGELQSFLRAQLKANIFAYYEKSQTRFQRSLLHVYGFENPDDFLLVDRPVAGEDEDLASIDQLAQRRKEQLAELKKLLPTLTHEQRLFIRLCLKYSFNYDRIAYYLGGISDYEVGMKVELILNELRQVMSCSDKLALLKKTVTKLNFEGDFNLQQQEVFRMRYTLHYSFEQIAKAMHLSEAQVKQVFVNAHAQVARGK